VDTGGQPIGPYVASDGAVWVSNYDGTLERVDPATNAVAARVDLGGMAEATTEAFGRVWSTNQDGTLSGVDPATATRAVGPVTVSRDVDDVAALPDGLWVSTFYAGLVAKVDPQSGAILARVQLPGQGSGLLAAAGSLWASVYNAGQVVRIDPVSGKIVATYDAGVEPRALAFDGTAVWVVDEGSNLVSRIAVG